MLKKWNDEPVEVESGILAELGEVERDLSDLSGRVGTLSSRISPVLENSFTGKEEGLPTNSDPSADSELILYLRALKYRIREIDKEVISITNRVQL